MHRQEIRISRLLILLLLFAGIVSVAFFTIFKPGASAPAAATLTASPVDQEVLSLGRSLAEAFGKGDLYQNPAAYPLTDQLLTLVEKRPAEAAWPVFVRLEGDVVIVLRGTDSHGREFVDIAAHVLSKAIAGNNLTQLDMRLVRVGGRWLADWLYTVPKGVHP